MSTSCLLGMSLKTMKGRTTKIKGVLTVLTTGGGGGKQLDPKNGGGLIFAHLFKAYSSGARIFSLHP